MQNFVSRDYELYRRWFERSLDLIWHMSPETRAMADPMAEVAKAERISPARAVKSVAAGLADTVSMTDRLPQEEVARLDALFEGEGLPSLSSLQALFGKKVRRILKARRVETEEDYYTLKPLEDADLPESSKEEIQSLLGDYELRLQSSS